MSLSTQRDAILTALQSIADFNGSVCQLVPSEQFADVQDKINIQRANYAAVGAGSIPFPSVDAGEGIEIFIYILTTDRTGKTADNKVDALAAAVQAGATPDAITRDAPEQLYDDLVKLRLKYRLVCYFTI